MDCVEETYVPMAPNDAGLSLGAALYVLDEAYRINPKIEVPRQISAHLGPEFSDSEILNELKLWPVTYSSPLDLNKSAAKSIADGKVVGWFQGKQELGPRALGSRSVLGNPKDKAIKAKVNQVLKKRDWFMPYAPSCLFEHSQEYFTDGPNAQFMSFALTPKTDSLPNEVIANISHVDGTSRAQFVKIEDNSGFHDLISEFYKISGVSILLNTSFNRHGIATISSPKQALEHLVCGNVEELYIGGYKVNSLIQVTPENSILFPESLEILMISLQPFFNYYSGKSNIFPKPSATLDKYLDIFSLEIHKNRLSSALVNIDLGSDVKGIRDQLSSLMSDNS
jgi:carbamoyltransferase